MAKKTYTTPDPKFIHVKIAPNLHDELMSALEKQSKAESRHISITEFVIEAAKKHVRAWTE